MMTYTLTPSWRGTFARWPARHAAYRLPAMYEPWHPVPDWLVTLIDEARAASGAPSAWMARATASAMATRLNCNVEDINRVVEVHELNVAQAVSLFDVLYAKAGRTREAVAEADPIEATANDPTRHGRTLAA